MLSIRLYQPRKIDLSIDFPNTWDELSAADLCIVARSFFGKELSRVELLIELLRLRLPAKRAHHILTLLDPETLSIEYMALTDFLIEGNDRSASVPVPGTTAPAPSFDDTTVGRFEDADVHLGMYLKDNDVLQLHDFFCSWYKTKEFPSIELAQAAALCFLGCKRQLTQLFPLVFGSTAKEEGKEAPADPLALTKLIHHAAGPKNGTREQIRAQQLKEFLFDCQLEAEKAPDVF